MTDTSIRAELRRAAMTEDPWGATSTVGAEVLLAFSGIFETAYDEPVDHQRWFLLLVAEAL